MFCSTCGHKLEDNTKFCSECGTRIEKQETIVENNFLIEDFLKEMEGPSIPTENIQEQTEMVHQDTKERLFLDDEDDYIIEDSEIIQKFFDNLENLEEDAPMELTSEYNPSQSYTPQIAPVFEEIPEAPIEVETPSMAYQEAPDEDGFNRVDDDDYSDIILGAASEFIPQPVQSMPKEIPSIQEEPVANDMQGHINEDEITCGADPELPTPTEKQKEVTDASEPVEENGKENQGDERPEDTVDETCEPVTDSVDESANADEVSSENETNASDDASEPTIILDIQGLPAEEAMDATKNAFTETPAEPTDELSTPEEESKINIDEIFAENFAATTHIDDIDNDFLDNEPHILIDERPDLEQKQDNNSFEINIDTANPEQSQTPYLDSFLVHRDINVDFEQPEITDDTDAVENVEVQSDEQCAETAEVAIENADASEETITINENQPEEVAPCENETATQQEEIVEAENTPTHTEHTTQEVMKDECDAKEAGEKNNVTEIEAPKKKKTFGKLVAVAGLLLIAVAVCVAVFGAGLFNKKQDNSINNPNWKIEKTSSIAAPLSVGHAANVKREIDSTKKNETLQVKVTNIYRGDDAYDMAQKYETETNIKLMPLDEGIEYVVVEYQVYVPSGIDGATYANLPLSVNGGNGDNVLFNDASYAVSTWCIDGGESAQAGSVVTCKEIFQMPVGCDSYYLVFGTQNSTTATYKGI